MLAIIINEIMAMHLQKQLLANEISFTTLDYKVVKT